VTLEEMRAAVKNFFRSMNGVSYDNDLGDSFIKVGLINESHTPSSTKKKMKN